MEGLKTQPVCPKSGDYQETGLLCQVPVCLSTTQAESSGDTAVERQAAWPLQVQDVYSSSQLTK